MTRATKAQKFPQSSEPPQSQSPTWLSWTMSIGVVIVAIVDALIVSNSLKSGMPGWKLAEVSIFIPLYIVTSLKFPVASSFVAGAYFLWVLSSAMSASIQI